MTIATARLQAADGIFKLVDPGGLRAERACDLGTIIRCNPDAGDDLHTRARRLAARTGVDATAIWEWERSTESSAVFAAGRSGSSRSVICCSPRQID
jgi:hypothetical protein